MHDTQHPYSSSISEDHVRDVETRILRWMRLQWPTREQKLCVKSCLRFGLGKFLPKCVKSPLDYVMETPSCPGEDQGEPAMKCFTFTFPSVPLHLDRGELPTEEQAPCLNFDQPVWASCSKVRAG